MKKTLFLLFVLVASSVYAQELSLIDVAPLSDVLAPGEVYQATITLQNPITSLTKQKITLYSQDNKVVKQPVAPFLIPLGNNHYWMYFEVPFSTLDGTYDLRIEDQSFLVNGALQVVPYEREVTITTSSPAISLTPGVIILPFENTGSFTVTAKAQDVQTVLNFAGPEYISHAYLTEQTLAPNVQRTFTFTYDTSAVMSDTLLFTSGTKQWSIPLVIEGWEAPILVDDNAIGEVITFAVPGGLLEREVSNDKTLQGLLFMHNSLPEALGPITFELTGNLASIIQLNPEQVQSVDASADFSVMVMINANKNPQETVYAGSLIVSSGAYESILPISVVVLPSDGTDVIEEPSDDLIVDDDTSIIEGGVDDTIADQLNLWDDLSDGYEEETQAATHPFMALIALLLVVAIIIFFLSGKKKTRKKSLNQVIRESKR